MQEQIADRTVLIVQGDRQLLYAADLLKDAELRKGAGRIESANGGVEFLTQDALILVDDIFDAVARALARRGDGTMRRQIGALPSPAIRRCAGDHRKRRHGSDRSGWTG